MHGGRVLPQQNAGRVRRPELSLDPKQKPFSEEPVPSIWRWTISMSSQPAQLDLNGIRRLLSSIEETPETVIPLHLMMQGACKVYSVGNPASSGAVTVQGDSLREEPFGIGDDAEALWVVLRHLDDWKVVDVSPSVAPRLGAIIREATGRRAWYYDDVYHTMTRPAPTIDDPAVRQFTRDDMDVLKAAGVDGANFRGVLPALIEQGTIAGAVVDGRIVSTAQSAAITGRYADIGVGTDERWRGRGFATAAASIVARRIQETGRTPVWSCGEDNMASLRVARKLGFKEVSRLTYVFRSM